MLQALRHHASSWIVKILFGFLILSFGLWGINDIFTGERDPAVAKVSGTKILLSQLNDGLRQEMERFQPLFGGALDREQAKQLGLVDQALDKLIDGAVFANAVADYGLRVNDVMIRSHIQNERAFHNARGQFDRNQFYQVLSRAGYTETSYVAGLRRDLATQQLVGAVTATTPAPRDLLTALHRYREEGRIANTITVPASESATPPLPDDAAIETYYKANIERFMAPEMRTIRYVLIDPAALITDDQVPDDRLKAEYENRIGDYTVRDKRDVDQAVLQSEAEAQKVGELLGQGKSLERALKEADSSASAVKLGLVEQADLIPEIAEPAFALKAGEHSAPIRGPLGWHVLKVNAVKAGHVKPFAEVRDDLRKYLAEDSAAREAHDLAIQFEDAMAGGASLDDAANRIGLKTVKLPPINANGLTAEGKPLEDSLLNDPRIMRAIFATPQDQESQLIEMPRNSFAMVRVEQVTPPAAKPFAKVKNEVIAIWREQERMNSARKRAEAIAARINKGESPAVVAKAEKLTLKVTPVFTRATHDSEAGVPESIKSQLFDVKLGAAVADESPDGYVVAILKEIKPAAEMPESARAELSAQLSETIASDLLDQLAAALRGRYNVDIDHDILDSRL